MEDARKPPARQVGFDRKLVHNRLAKPIANWRTYDEPDRDVAVAHWVERGISVVFPLTWAAHHGQAEMIARAKERIAEVEAKAAGKRLETGSVLLAFSTHVLHMRDGESLNPDVTRSLFTMGEVPYEKKDPDL